MMKPVIINFDHMQDYVHDTLIHMGYAPTHDEMTDVIDCVIGYLGMIGVVEMVDDVYDEDD